MIEWTQIFVPKKLIIIIFFGDQVFIVYFIAGLKKLDFDWLAGYSMGKLGSHWLFQPFRLFLSEEMTCWLVVHGGGFALDISAGFLLTFPVTRLLGLVMTSYFHLMNSQLFNIGMFPYAMIATGPLFLAADWPKRLEICHYPESTVELKRQQGAVDSKVLGRNKLGVRWIHHVGAAFTVIYICEQLFLPYSHFISQGYNTWTGGLYGYSWDMMIHSRLHQHVRIMYKDGKTGETGFLKPGLKSSIWKDHPDMQRQYAACAAHILQTWHGVQEPQIYMDIWSSLNDRFQQRLVDPRVDLVRAKWSPLRPTPWLLPLLAELSPWRQRLRELDAQLSEGEEAVFLADFPGLHLENFITSDLQVSIEVLSGSVAVETPLNPTSDENDPQNWQNTSLSIGETMKLPSGSYHRVYPLSSEPACYGYISFNQTLAEIKHNLTRLISLREAILNGTFLSMHDVSALVVSEGRERAGYLAAFAQLDVRTFPEHQSPKNGPGQPNPEEARQGDLPYRIFYRCSILMTSFAIRNLVLGHPSQSQLLQEHQLADWDERENMDSDVTEDQDNTVQGEITEEVQSPRTEL
uniref:HTTM-like domain-containing protein n=1 Tax=Eptatretus burgeri TaxID=7764 RepID=A0A8C4QY37_EPTBU